MKEALWDASIDKAVSKEPCSTHPPDIVKTRYQRQFLDRRGVRCFFPEPQRGGNSNTGNIATQVFQNSLSRYLESRKLSSSACGSSLRQSAARNSRISNSTRRRPGGHFTCGQQQEYDRKRPPLDCHGGMYLSTRGGRSPWCPD